MNTDSILLLFDIIMLGYGIYCLYIWLKLRKTGVMPEKSLLLSQELPMKNCIDPEEYVQYMKPRLFVFGLLISILALFCLVDEFFGLMAGWTASMELIPALLVEFFVTCALPLAVLIWFGVCTYRIQKRLW